MKRKQSYSYLRTLLNKESVIYTFISILILVVISIATPFVSLLYRDMIDLLYTDGFILNSIILIVIIYILNP